MVAVLFVQQVEAEVSVQEADWEVERLLVMEQPLGGSWVGDSVMFTEPPLVLLLLDELLDEAEEDEAEAEAEVLEALLLAWRACTAR